MGESGLTCLADRQLSDINIEEIDSLLLPGCMDIGTLVDEQELLYFIQTLDSQGAVIASISSSLIF